MDSPFFPAVVSDVPRPRCTLCGSLDPTTGIFYRAPERTRVRTAQACDKCRIRKAKCSGDHPVCERCRIRGLTCNYAGGRRTHPKVERDAVSDGSTGRPGSQPRSSTSTSYGPSFDGQRSGGARPRRATIASAELRSLSSGRSEMPFSQRVLDLRRVHSHPLSVAPEALCGGGDEKGTLDDIDLRIGENALALCFDPDSPPLVESIFTPGATGDDVSRVTHPGFINPGLTRAEYPVGVDGAQHPVPSHCPPRSHRSGPGPGSRLDISSVELGVLSNDERSALCHASDAESPGWTPSTSSSASPILTRASPDGLPTTPTNTYPNSPLGLASLSLHVGPFVGDPNAYPLFASEVQNRDMGIHGLHHDGVLTEYVAWHEVKDGTRAFGGNLGLFVDMDAVY